MSNVALSILTDEQARTLIRQELEQFFSNHLVTANPEEAELKVVDLNGLLKVRPFIGSRSTLYKKIQRGLLPHSKQGKKLYFNLAEIDNWLLANKTKSQAEIVKATDDYFKFSNRKRR